MFGQPLSLKADIVGTGCGRDPLARREVLIDHRVDCGDRYTHSLPELRIEYLGSGCPRSSMVRPYDH